MDYDDWLRQKEGNSPYRDLEDSVKRSVDNMYKSVTCPQCGMSGEMINDHMMKCNGCGNYWSIYS